ncbi:MAG: hypothetical protein HRU11_01085 [Parvularculaceae bacterium]|nr:hypothetical protein [Parvularculaceae bacterium]
MRLVALLFAAFAACSVSGCSSMQFMSSPSRLEAQRRAACQALSDYHAREECLAACWERQQIIWTNEIMLDRQLRAPSSLADDPGLAHAIFGG